MASPSTLSTRGLGKDTGMDQGRVVDVLTGLCARHPRARACVPRRREARPRGDCVLKTQIEPERAVEAPGDFGPIRYALGTGHPRRRRGAGRARDGLAKNREAQLREGPDGIFRRKALVRYGKTGPAELFAISIEEELEVLVLLGLLRGPRICF